MYDHDIVILGAGTIGLSLARYLVDAGHQDFLIIDLGNSEDFADNIKVEFSNQKYDGVNKGRVFGKGGTSSIWGGAFSTPDRNDLQRQFGPIEGTILDISKHSIRQLEKYFKVKLPPCNNLKKSKMFERVGVTWPHFWNRNTKIFLKNDNLSKNLASGYFIKKIKRFGDLTEVHTVSKNGEVTIFRCNKVICCLGSIETTRLLLASGVNNKLLGKNFHDHLSVKFAEGTIQNKKTFFKHFFMRINRRGFSSERYIFDIKNIRGFIHFAPVRRKGGGFELLREISLSVQTGKLLINNRISFEHLKFLWRFTRNLVTNRVIIGDYDDKFEVYIVVDQSTLSDTNENQIALDRDVLYLNWEKKIILKKIDFIVEKAIKHLTGPFTLQIIDIDINNLTDVYHPAGTTPLSRCPLQGVVSANDGSVFNLPNVYVCSTSMLAKIDNFSPTGVCILAGFEMLNKILSK